MTEKELLEKGFIDMQTDSAGKGPIFCVKVTRNVNQVEDSYHAYKLYLERLWYKLNPIMVTGS